jgi:NADPH2 dehydrogenase
MQSLYLNRWSPLKTKRNYVLKNRVVVPPMASETATAAGEASERTIAHYGNLALSGAGLVIVEYTYVHASGRSEENQLGISEDRHIEGLRKVAQIIRRSQGAVAGIQITHSGGKSDSILTAGELMGPSGVTVPVKDRILEAPKKMSAVDIQTWKDAFRSAVERAVKAGFDLVEFHAAHGYGLNQWLSPITNHRNDEYGATIGGRFRLLREIVEDARKSHPELLISVRIPGQDFIENGLSMQDSIQLAKLLEEIGVDFIHVSSGIGGWRRPNQRNGEGYLVAEAEAIQSAVQIPVIGVGGIATGEYIDQSLQAKRFLLAAVGRAILADPMAWACSQMMEEAPISGRTSRSACP